MTAIAAYNKVVKEGAVAIPATSASLSRGGNLLDDTDIAEAASTGFRSRLAGIKDWSIKLDGPYDPANAALIALEAAWLAGSVVAMHYLPNGTVGFGGNALVESFDVSGDVNGLEVYSCSMQADGALAAE